MNSSDSNSPNPPASPVPDFGKPSECPACLNGQMICLADARISVLDRGFLFADGVYEVVPIFNGCLFRWPAHRARLAASLKGLMFEDAALDIDAITADAQKLASLCAGGHACLYLQISRGAYDQRNHDIPGQVEPTVVMWLTSLPDPHRPRPPLKLQTISDIRWDWCHIKSIALLGNILMREQARRGGYDDALLVREGRVVEATAANIVLVNKGIVQIPDSSESMLPGITRQVIIDLAKKAGIAYEIIAPPAVAEVVAADEAWLCSSTKLMLAIDSIDGQALAPRGDKGAGARLLDDFIALVDGYGPESE